MNARLVTLLFHSCILINCITNKTVYYHKALLFIKQLQKIKQLNGHSFYLKNDIMKLKLTTTLFMLLCMNSFAQSEKPSITDDLLKDKDAVKAKYFSKANGWYFYKMYEMPPEEFIKKLNDFKASFNEQINKVNDEALKELERKDIEYYCRYIIHYNYIPGYGLDSIKMIDFGKFRTLAEGAPNEKHLIDSAAETIHVKKLTPEEKTRLENICWGNPDLDNTELFKRSRAYRDWLSDYYWFRVRAIKYAALPGRGGYLGDPLGMLTVINNEVKSTFIREYYAYRMVNSIIKQEKDNNVKEKAYNDFMAVVTIPYYKDQVTTVYGNYKKMISSAPAPDFTYININNQQVSLKDFRGKYVYIDVWATWCSPCKAEIPFLTKLEEDYHGKNIQFISLSVDYLMDRPKWVSYVKDHNLNGIQVVADNDFNSDFIKKFNINSIPRFIIIDPAGSIVSGDASGPSNPELRKQLDVLLK
jgi:thiol-disulfide isomerase/thioredoxin